MQGCPDAGIPVQSTTRSPHAPLVQMPSLPPQVALWRNKMRLLLGGGPVLEPHRDLRLSLRPVPCRRRCDHPWQHNVTARTAASMAGALSAPRPARAGPDGCVSLKGGGRRQALRQAGKTERTHVTTSERGRARPLPLTGVARRDSRRIPAPRGRRAHAPTVAAAQCGVPLFQRHQSPRDVLAAASAAPQIA